MVQFNFLENFLFRDNQSFGELLSKDVEAEIELLYKKIATTKEAISRYNINLENIKPFLDEPKVYRRKQLELSRKDLKKAKDYSQKNKQLLKQVQEKLAEIQTKKFKDKFFQEIGPHGYIILQAFLTNYKDLLVSRSRELDGIVSTVEQDINVRSKFDEETQKIDMNLKTTTNQKMIEKEQNVIQEAKQNIKELQALQKWIKSIFNNNKSIQKSKTK